MIVATIEKLTVNVKRKVEKKGKNQKDKKKKI